MTSYKPFAQTNYVDEDNNKIRSLSSIDEEIIKTTALLQLKEKLFNVSPTVKSSLVYAQQVTDIINNDHLLGFLYVENYNVDVSTSVDIGLDGKVYIAIVIVYISHFLYDLPPNQYTIQRALTRLLRYWNSRHKVFGDDYILPLTLYGM